MCGDHKFNPIRPFEGSWDQIWPTGALLGPPKSPKGPFVAKTSPFRAPLGPKGARYQVKVCGDHESNPGGPMGGSWDQICPPGPSEDLWGPKRGLSGPKGTPFACVLELGGSHCGQVGPHLGTRVPIGTVFSLWVPILCQGPHFFISGLRMREKSMQPLHKYNVENLITCDSTTTTNESHVSLSVKSVLEIKLL